MEEAQPLPQHELPLCDSLIIWVSVRGRGAWLSAGESVEERGPAARGRVPSPPRCLSPLTSTVRPAGRGAGVWVPVFVSGMWVKEALRVWPEGTIWMVALAAVTGALPIPLPLPCLTPTPSPELSG